jgi:hypothetical protein
VIKTDRIQYVPLFALLAAATLGAACQTPPAESPSAGPAASAQPTAAPPEPAAPAPATSEPASPAPPATSAPASAPATGGHVFRVKVPAVGTRALETETDTMSLAISVFLPNAKAPHKSDMSEREVTEKIVEVLAANADAVTKVKVTYKAHSKVKKEDGADTSKPSPVQGKTYIVEGKDGTVQVTLPGGSPAPEEAAKLVAKDFKRLGKPDRMQKAMPSTPIEVGARVDSLGEALREDLVGDDEPDATATIDKSIVTLTAVREEGGAKLGVFDVELEVLATKKDLAMRFSVKGKVEVGLADSIPVAMSFESPVAAASTSGRKVAATGRATKSSTRKVQ